MIINSTSEWHWMEDKEWNLDQALQGWGFDIEALREKEREGVSPLSTKSPRANNERLIDEISKRL